MKVPIFTLSNMLWWKFAKFLMSFLKAQVSFPSNVASIFSAIKQNSPTLFLAQTYTLFKRSSLKCKFLRLSFFNVLTQNSPVKFKLIHFLLWIKGSHQSPNFLTFQCSGENFLNSSCHFWKYKSVFDQVLHQSSVPSNIYNSSILYLAQTLYTMVKGSPLKCKFLTGLQTKLTPWS